MCLSRHFEYVLVWFKGYSKQKNNCSECRSDYVGYPCINNNYGFGYAITGVDDDKPGMPLSLAVDESSEPNTREGSKPSHMHGPVTVSGLSRQEKLYSVPMGFCGKRVRYYESEVFPCVLDAG